MDKNPASGRRGLGVGRRSTGYEFAGSAGTRRITLPPMWRGGVLDSATICPAHLTSPFITLTMFSRAPSTVRRRARFVTSDGWHAARSAETTLRSGWQRAAGCSHTAIVSARYSAAPSTAPRPHSSASGLVMFKSRGSGGRQTDGTEPSARGYTTIPTGALTPSRAGPSWWRGCPARSIRTAPPHLFGTNTELSRYRSHMNCH